MVSSVIAWNGTKLRRHIAGQVEHHFVHITPAPAFGRIVALDDGMLGAVEMLGGVLAAGLVAAAHMAASAAHPQVKPFPAQLEALLAALGAGRDRGDGIEMGTEFLAHCAATLCAASSWRARKAWIADTTVEPSPTAAATRLTEPQRTSPTAKTPSRLVASRWALSAPVTTKPFSSRWTPEPFSQSVLGSAPMKEKT